ncbi:MAG: hypothetical protein VYB56_01170 [Actinomycetota bacterium]|nr:hypothetical protein [Actinomycetota bacterium]
MDGSSSFSKPNSALKALTVFGDNEIKEEINHRYNENAFPLHTHKFALSRDDGVSNSQEIKEANNCQERRFFKRGDDLAHELRNRDRQRLGQDNKPCSLRRC